MFTKGEWKTSFWIDQPGNVVKPMVMSDGLTIAITHPCPAVSEEECQANANVMAASKDLYEALKDIITQYPHIHPGEPPAWIRNGAIALTKAEGKS